MEAQIYLTRSQWDDIVPLLEHVTKNDGAIIAQPPSRLGDPMRLKTVTREQAETIFATMRPKASAPAEGGGQ